MDERQEKFGWAFKEWERTTKAIFERMPENYEELSRYAMPLTASFRSVLAKHLEPVLNREASLRSSAAFTYKEMHNLSVWINEEVAKFGLSLVSKTSFGNRHSIISVEPQGTSNGSRVISGLYYFEFLVGERWERTEGTSDLPELRLGGTSVNSVYVEYTSQIKEWTKDISSKTGRTREIK